MWNVVGRLVLQGQWRGQPVAIKQCRIGTGTLALSQRHLLPCCVSLGLPKHRRKLICMHAAFELQNQVCFPVY